MLEQHRVEQFLFPEARLIDERRFAEWEELWDDEGIYWVPANGDDTDPGPGVSLIYDNRSRLHTGSSATRSARRSRSTRRRARSHIVANVAIEPGRIGMTPPA